MLRMVPEYLTNTIKGRQAFLSSINFRVVNIGSPALNSPASSSFYGFDHIGAVSLH